MKCYDFDWQINEFMVYCRSTQLRERTMYSYEQTLRLFERWLCDELKIYSVDKVTENMIRKYIECRGVRIREWEFNPGQNSGDAYADNPYIWVQAYSCHYRNGETRWQVASDFVDTPVSIAASVDHTVILYGQRVDAVGSNYYGQCNVSGWDNIIQISALRYHTVGLTFDGRVVAAGLNTHGQCDVSSWRDIIAVAAGEHHTVGLRSNGTVVATGLNRNGECDVSGWKNIVAVAAS